MAYTSTTDPEDPPREGEEVTFSNLCASASTLLAKRITPTEYLSPPLCGVALSLVQWQLLEAISSNNAFAASIDFPIRAPPAAASIEIFTDCSNPL